LAQTNKCALVITDGMETKTLPSRFEEGKSTMLEYVLDSVWTVADEIFVIFESEPSLSLVERVAPFGVKVAIDREGGSQLTRILTGFRASSSESCLIVPSSAPFVKPNVIFHLFESIQGADAAIPRWKGGKADPLLSVYRRKSVLRAAAQLKSRSIRGLVKNLYTVSYVDVEDFLRPLDPELLSFFRVATERDLRTARKIAASREQ